MARNVTTIANDGDSASAPNSSARVARDNNQGYEASTGILPCKLFNASSLMNKLDKLSCVLQSSHFDVIFVTESWLRHDFPDALLLSNTAYDLFRKDRPDIYGVAVFLRNTLEVVSFDLPPIYSSLECVAFDVVLSTASCYLFICFYNPPSCVNSVDIITLCSLIDFLSMTNYPLFIVGDFNLPDINCDVPIAISLGCPSHNLFLNCVTQNGLTQIVPLMVPIVLIWS